MAVTFLNQLLFVQFQRETTQNKKLIRGLPPFWGRDGLTGAPPSCSQQSKLFVPFFLEPKACPVECSECNSSSYCTSCENDYELINGKNANDPSPKSCGIFFFLLNH